MNAQGFDILKCYEVLDIRPGATVETVRKAYVELAHVWDPALHVNNPPLMHVAEEKRKEIDAAYNALQAFLPDLSRGAHAEPERPVRPDDAISDEASSAGVPEKSAYLYMVFIVLITAFLMAGSVFLWRSMHHLSTVLPAAVAE